MENIEISNILKRGNRSLDLPFLIEFSRLYNDLRKTLLPYETRDKIMELIDCKQRQYYTYLRLSRNENLINDSHADNNELQRQRELEKLLSKLEEINKKSPCGVSVDIPELRRKGYFYILRKFFSK